MIERETMEDDKDMYKAMLRMSKMVDMLYEGCERQEKGRAENDAPSTPSSECSSHSSSSNHSNEDINQGLQVDNVELKMLIQEEKERKHRLQLQL